MSLSKCLDQHIRMLDREDYDSVRANARALENGGMPRAEAEKAAVKRVLEDVNESANDLRRQLADQGVDVAVRPIKEKVTPKSAPKLPETGAKVGIPKPEPKPVPDVGRTTAEQKAVAAESRPDLANPGSSEAVRDMVRKARAEMITPERKAQEQSLIEGKALLADPGKKAELDRKVKAGEILNDTETAAFLQFLDQEGDAAIKAGGDKLKQMIQATQGYTRGGTEQGRALAMRHDRNETPAERRKTALIRAILMPSQRLELSLRKVQDKLKRAAPSERALLQKAADKITDKEVARVEKFKKRMAGLGYDIDNMEMLYQNDAMAAAIVDEARIDKADNWDATYEWWISSILSGPKTNITNLTGNAGNFLLNYLYEKPATALLGKVVDAATGTKGSGPSIGELKAVYSTLLSGDAWGYAIRHFLDSYAVERPMLDAEMESGRALSRDEAKMMTDQDNKYLAHAPVNKNKVAKALRSVGIRALMAFDQFFKGLGARAEVAGRAYKLAKENGYSPGSPEFAEFMAQEVSDLESQSWEHAYTEAKRLVFNQDTGKATQAVVNVRNAVPGSRYVLPFIPILVNLIGRGLTLAPITAQINMAQRMIRHGVWQASPGSRGALPYARHEFVQQLASSTVGLLAYAAIASLAEDDEDGFPGLTGTEPRYNRAKDETVPAKSIRIGGTYYSYERLDPFSSVFASVADISRERGKESPDYTKAAISNLSYQVLDKSFMSTINELVKAVSEGETGSNTVARLMRSTLVGFIPNVIRQPVSMGSDATKDQTVYARTDPSSGDWWTEQGRILAGSSVGGLPFVPKVDLWGQEAKRGQPTGNVPSDFFWRALSPSNARDGRASNAYEQSLYNWNKTAEKPSWPSYPRNYLERKDGTRWYYTSEQYNDMLRERGRILMDNLGEWKPEDPLKPKDWEIKRIRNAMTLASKLARLPYVQKLGYESVKAAEGDE